MTRFMLFTALATGLCMPQVMAQDLEEGDVPVEYSGLEKIVTTAQRRESVDQDTAVALTTFSGEAIVQNGIETVNNLENFTPNLEIESQFGSGAPSFAIRGVGFRDYATNNSPTVGIYVDDVSYPVPVATQGVLFDVQRVEVLRGPQGTLYGRNTTAGAIKVISNRPIDEGYGAGFVVEAGRFGRVDAEGYVTGAVTDAFRLRLSGTTSQGGDWQVNRETGETLGDNDIWAGRLLAELDLSDRLMATFNFHGFTDKSDGLGLQLFNDSVFGFLKHEDRRETSYGSSQEFADLVGIGTQTKPFRDSDGYGLSLTLDWELGDNHDLTYVGAYESMDRTEFNDFDALPIGGAGVFFQSDIEFWSQELRFSGEVADVFRYVTGVFYGRENLDEIYQSDFVDSFGPGFAVTTPYSQEVRTIGVFAHGEWDISDQVTFVGGIRYEEEERDLIGLGTFGTGFGPFNFANGTVDGTLEDRSLDTGEVSGKVGLEYRPVDDLLFYANYSRGVKSGGFTAYNTLNPNAINPFQPEELNAYEAGFKSEWLENTLRFNSSVFLYRYKDQQIQSAIFDDATGAVVGRIVNAPRSEIWGAEVEAQWQPVPNLTISQAVGFKEGEFKDFDDLDAVASTAAGTTVTTDRSGQSLGFPELTYSGQIDYFNDEIVPDYEVSANFSYYYRDDTTPPLLGPVYTVESYWTANAEVGFAPKDSHWKVAFWGRNIFNTEFDETRNFFIGTGNLADVAAPTRPATYGIRVSAEY